MDEIDLVRMGQALRPAPFRLQIHKGSALTGSGWTFLESGEAESLANAVIFFPFRSTGDGPTHITLRLRELQGGRLPPSLARARFNGHPLSADTTEKGDPLFSIPAAWWNDVANQLRLMTKEPVLVDWFEVALPAAESRMLLQSKARHLLMSGSMLEFKLDGKIPKAARIQISLAASADFLPPGSRSVLYLLEVESNDGRRETLFKKRIKRRSGTATPRWFEETLPLPTLSEGKTVIRCYTISGGGSGKQQAALQAWGPLRIVDPSRERHPDDNLIVLLVDTLRADRLGAYGGLATATPFADRLARRALLFENVVCQATSTVPSMKSFHTGERFAVLDQDVRSSRPTHAKIFAKALRDSNRFGMAVIANPLLRPEWGFGRGIDDFGYMPLRHDARGINATFLRHLDRHAGGRFFAWLHYMDVHNPWGGARSHRSELFAEGHLRGRPISSGFAIVMRELRETGRTSIGARDRASLARRYDDGIAYFDQELGRLLAALKQRRLLESTTIALLADHGEEVFDHGLIGHGHSLYDELLRVPAIIALPGGKASGHVGMDAEPVEMLDLSATLLSVMGVAKPDSHKGRVLEFLANYRGHQSRPRFFGTRFRPGAGALFNKRLAGVEEGSLKLILDRPTGRFQLFDLSTDPRERHNLAEEQPEAAKRLRNKLATVFPEEGNSAESGDQSFGATEKRLMRELGYIQ